MERFVLNRITVFCQEQGIWDISLFLSKNHMFYGINQNQPNKQTCTAHTSAYLILDTNFKGLFFFFFTLYQESVLHSEVSSGLLLQKLVIM